MNFFFLLSIAFTLLGNILAANKSLKNYITTRNFDGEVYTIINGFDSFKDLMSDSKRIYEAGLVEFFPNKPLIVDESFQLDKMKIRITTALTMINLKGFETQINLNFINYQLVVAFSEINLYMNGDLVQRKSDCQENNQTIFNHFIKRFLRALRHIKNI